MLRIAICDDMPDFLKETSLLAQQWPGQPDNMNISLFSDADALMEAHAARPFDILFLDVVMPLLNGIEAAGEIRKTDKTVKIVFLTFSPEFAVDSYRVKADDYLLKPLDRERFFTCLDECYADILDKAKFITVRGSSALHRVLLQDIEYIEAQGKQVLFALSGGNTVEALDPFYAYEDKLLLEDGFFKCHRSYVVNVYKINTYTQKEITMRSGCRIPISRSCHKGFESAYFSLLFGKADDL